MAYAFGANPQFNTLTNPLMASASVTPPVTPPPTPPAAPPVAPSQQPIQMDDTSRTRLAGVVTQMQQNNEPDQNIQAAVDTFKQKWQNNTLPPDPNGPKPGFFGKLVLGLGIPQTAQSLGNVFGATSDLITGKGTNAAMHDLNAPFNSPTLGQVQPLFKSTDTNAQFAEKVPAEALKIGSLLVGGEGAAEGAGETLAGQIGRGAVSGALHGATAGLEQGVGSALADPTETPILQRLNNVGTQGLLGAATGGVGGAVIGAGAPLLGKGLSYAFGGGAKQAASDIGENVSTKLAESKAANDFVAAQTPEVQNAVNRGIDPGDIKILQNSSQGDLGAAQRMMDIKQGNLDGTIPTHTHLPIEVPGQEIVNQANHLAGVQDAAGKQLNQIVSNMPQTPQDTTGIANRFLDDLQKNNNVKLGADGNLDFSRSNMSGSTQAGDRNLISSLWSRLQPGENGEEMTPQDLHSLRQSIFEDVGLGKQQKVLGISETPAINLRNDIANHLDNLSEDYKNTNQVYAKATGAVNKFNGMLGKPFDFSNDGIKALRAGEIGQRILGNAPARPINMLNELGDTARSLGYKSDANIFNQIKMSDMLDDYMGNTQSRGLQGQVTRAVQNVTNAGNAASDIASAEGPVQLLVKGAKAAYNYAAEAPESVRTNALRNVIQSLQGK